ncbi:MAG: hypothetical protein HZC54_01755 [Verrucomicrobia bacterium]|nr:hypothetical protein [Verrucomicrobiota bacterium]
MNKPDHVMTALPMFALALSGCAIGYNHTMFGTKSNFGLDIDSKPPTAEVSLARRETAIAPTFENGQTTPVMASFALAADAEATFPMFAAYSSTFSGGDAAVTMAALFTSPEIGNPASDYSSVIPLKSAPTNSILFKTITLQRPGTMHPFAFATDTTAGLKIAWSGTTGQYPDTIRFGVNRKELALAPVFGGETHGPNGITYAAHMPSFLATVDHSGGAGLAPGLRYKHLQFFATGKAADKLALQPGVRAAMAARFDPLAKDQADRFMQFRTAFQDQTTLVEASQAGFKNATDADKQKIITKAVELKLVPAGTKPDAFSDTLSDAVNTKDAGVTSRLKQLKDSLPK